MKKLSILFVLFIMMFTVGRAQEESELSKTLNKLSLDAATAYVNPVISAFGSNLNSGWAGNVPESKILGFDLELRILGQASFFPSDAKEFSTNGSFRLSSEMADQLMDNSNINNPSVRTELKNQMLSSDFMVQIAGPTIVGSKDKEVSITVPSKTYTAYGNSYTVTGMNLKLDGVNGVAGEIPVFPFAAVQLNLGTVYGTSLSVRFFPEINSDLGKFSFYGVGAMHNPAMFLPFEMPVDVAVGAFYQSMKLGDIFKSSALQFGLFASKEFGSIISVTPYAGLTVENATTTLAYDYTYDANIGGVITPVKFHQTVDLKAKNGVGLTLGTKIHLAFINLIVDYKMANTSTVNGGISFSF